MLVADNFAGDSSMLSVEHLAKINGIDNPDEIFAGDYIRNVLPNGVENLWIPAGESSAPKLSDFGTALTLPTTALDKTLNDNPVLRLTTGAVETTSAVASGGLSGFVTGWDGLVRITSGIQEIVTEMQTKQDIPTPEVTNLGSIVDRVIQGATGNERDRTFEKAMETGATLDSFRSGDPFSGAYGLFDLVH